MEGTGMFEALAGAIVSIIPPSLNSFAHIIFGLLSTPLSFLLNTDAMIYGILPVVVNVGNQYGISPAKIAAMIISGHVMASGLCMTTASTYLGLGLMNIEYKDGFKFIFKWSLLLGSAMVLLSAAIVN
jgi:CitMHS family citrate-Mg2+:H+ or citrate-Ca2+:H+ symporter